MDVNIHPTKAEVRFTNEKSVSDAIYFAVKNAMMKDGLIYEFELKPHTDWTKTAPEPEEIKQQEFIFTPVDKIEETEQKLSEAPAPVHTAPKQVREEMPVITNINLRPAYSQPETVQQQVPVYERKAEKTPEPVKTSESVKTPESEKEPEPLEAVEGFSYITQQSFAAVPVQKPAEPEAPTESVWTEKPKIRVIGEVFGLYIVAEVGDDTMIMIDKHAAHERILFEKLKSRNCRQYSQQLLTGVKVLLTGDEFSALETNQELLADMGFAFDFSEKPCAVATAVPTFIMELEMEEIISEIANNLRMNSRDPQSHALDDMLHTVACKSAIKGNDKNDIVELQSLAEQVYFDERIRHCPHGRPVMFTMTKSNISHQFKRT